MSFEEIWYEHKTFILSLLGGVVFFFVADMIIAGPHDDQIAKDTRAIKSAARKTKRQKLPPGSSRDLDNRLDELSTARDELVKQLAYRPAERFTLNGISGSPDTHFNEVVQSMLSEVVEPALSLDVRIPFGLGLNEVTPRTNADREWYLNGLDIVNRISLAAVNAGVRSVGPLKIARPPSKKARSRRLVSTPFVRELKVTFGATGHPIAVDELIRDLMVDGARLVVDKAEIRSLDEPDGGKKSKSKRRLGGEHLVFVEMTLKALLVDTEGSESWPADRRL